MDVLQKSLPNGARLLFVRDLGCPSVTVMCLVKVGSRNESNNQGGIAHIIEHNIFKGTQKRPSAKAFSYEVENLGATMNAYTTKEYTEYYLKAPKEKLPFLIEILADLVSNPIFPEQELSKEKLVIIEEIKMYQDIPQERISDYFVGKLYKHHKLGGNIAGTVDSVTNINRNDCLEFHKKHYIAENLLIVISGDFDPEIAEKYLDENFAKFPKGKIEKIEIFKPYILGNRSYQISKKLAQTHIVLGGFGHSYHLTARQRIAYSLGSTILSGGFGSKLYQKIREDLGLAYYIHLYSQQYNETGHFEVSLGVDHKNIQLAISAVIKELQDFISSNVSKVELNRAKNLLEGNFITYFETSETLANWFGSQILLHGNEVASNEELVRIIKSVNLEEVIEMWEPLISKENMQLTTLGYDKNIEKFHLF